MAFLAARATGAGLLLCAMFAPTAQADTLPMWVGPDKRPCMAGVMPMQCLMVKWRADQKDWDNFFSPIAGFDPRPGYLYKIVVRRSSVANPPADASALRYELVKVVMRKRR